MNKYLFSGILIAFCGICAYSQNSRNSDLIKSAGDAKNNDNANVVAVYDSTIVDVRETGLSYSTMHKLVKILTTTGAKENKVAVFGYDPLSADVQLKVARIYKKNGMIITLDVNKVKDYPAPARSIFWGAREKMIEFGRLEPGDAIETITFRKGFTYALLQDQGDEDKFIPPMKGQFYDIVEFYSKMPVKEKVYLISLPADKQLQYCFYNGESSSNFLMSTDKINKEIVVTNPQKVQSPEAGITKDEVLNRSGKNIYCWTKKDIIPYKSEPSMVSPSDVAPKLLLSTTKDWFDKSLWFYNVNESYKSFEVTPDVKKKVDEILKNTTDEGEKIAKLTHWVAEEVRYSGLSMGKGEGYTLHKGSVTYLDRCGVCKDKAGMLITMLRAAGFESYPAMTMAGSRIDRIPADQFNHSVAVVKRSNGQWNLLDPTWVPGVRELWSSAEQQQQFLMGIPGGVDLMTTPISPAENHYWKLNNKAVLNDKGTLEGTITLQADGQSDASIRRAFSRSYRSEWEEYIPSAIHEFNPKAEILEQYYQNPDDLSKPMTIKVRYRIPEYAIINQGKIIFTPLAAANPFRDGSMTPEMYTDTTMYERAYGFRMRCSKLTEITDTTIIPDNGGVAFIPQFKTVIGKAAAFDGKYSIEKGNMLVLNAKHRMEKRVYEANEWPDFRNALAERIKMTQLPVIFKMKIPR
ncbi:MAG: DUF3857 and transglutaminase domain-containing protein [Bacteroidota bacterium]|nr:DUF3857 and transglutaminase domain-containing protein [Bacteroidota bacterium]